MTVEYILSFDPGTINMAYCLVHIDTLKIIKWGLFSIKDSTIEGSCTKLAKHLDILKLVDGLNVIIVIESQPKINSKTLTIAGQLFMYYVLEKIDNKGIVKIVNYHAKNKIKYYIPRPEDPPWPEKLDKLKKGHYKTKQILIEHCRRILVHNNETQEWIDFFESGSKLDDKADSYVMNISYIKTNNLREKTIVPEL
jgi:hypothetical protein